MPEDHELTRNLKETGWRVVLIPEDEEGPPFAFTLGLYHSFLHPEILIMGLELETMHSILNSFGSQIKLGKSYADAEEVPDILSGYNCAFRAVIKSNYYEFLGSAVHFYRNEDFPVLQCFWPDKNGFYPYQSECSERVVERQWLLSKTWPKL